MCTRASIRVRVHSFAGMDVPIDERANAFQFVGAPPCPHPPASAHQRA
jgi:hypothetical protein